MDLEIVIQGKHHISLEKYQNHMTDDQLKLLTCIHSLSIEDKADLIKEMSTLFNTCKEGLGYLCDKSSDLILKFKPKFNTDQIVDVRGGRNGSCGMRGNCILCPLGALQRQTYKGSRSCEEIFEGGYVGSVSQISMGVKEDLLSILNYIIYKESYIVDIVEI